MDTPLATIKVQNGEQSKIWSLPETRATQRIQVQNLLLHLSQFKEMFLRNLLGDERQQSPSMVGKPM